MNFFVITLFPELFENFLKTSIIGRAIKSKKISVKFINLRDFGIGERKQVDDTPYGGGAGMVLRVDVVAKALETLNKKLETKSTKTILLTPQGKKIDQKLVKRLSALHSPLSALVLICGHYEGFDERTRGLVDEEISIGDYVLTGGELPAMVLIDALSRQVPGVLGKQESLGVESFDNNLLEYPQYTKPAEFLGKNVPEILLSGDHKKIEIWRHEQAIIRTKERRGDLL